MKQTIKVLSRAANVSNWSMNDLDCDVLKGLAVGRNVSGVEEGKVIPGERWSLYHITSGQSITTLSKKRDAVALRNEIVDMIDWSLPVSQLENSDYREVVKHIKEITKKYYALD